MCELPHIALERFRIIQAHPKDWPCLYPAQSLHLLGGLRLLVDRVAADLRPSRLQRLGRAVIAGVVIIPVVQRRLGLGYPKAARFIDMMEQDRIIGPGQGAKPREILVGPEYLAKRGK